jgi:hypothetical protein
MADKERSPIDLDFRPETYWPAGGDDRGRITNEMEWRLRQAQETGDWSRAHLPGVAFALRGGDFLPPFHAYEVEIARLSLESATWDVTSFRARPIGSRIAYRAVDEYPDG